MRLISQYSVLGVITALFAGPIGGHAEDVIAGRALLVGVSHYPHLSERYQLQGPENDVQLMRELLMGRFSFSAENIRTLSEKSGSSDPALLPTRANIEREFIRLGETVKAGEQVVIFLAGHGAQQPEQDGGVPELDGLDEIFLPRDVRPWQADTQDGVPNAIIDNEIGQWLRPIQLSGARLWVIFDCCHSGDMTRGLGERERFVAASAPDGLAIPAAAIDAARLRAVGRTASAEERTRGPAKARMAVDLPVLDNLAVFYACQSHEKAIERPFPAGPDGTPHGLLTYSINSVLSKATGPLSYRELSRRIHQEYIAAGRLSGPTPLIEGIDIDNAVLSHNSIERSQIHVALDLDGATDRGLRIDAGRLRGITPNSVLAVFPPPGLKTQSKDDKTPLGHVRVTDVDIATAIVTSCEFGRFPRKPARSLAGGRCEIVEMDYGDLRLPVCADPNDAGGNRLPVEVHSEMEALLRELAAEKESLVVATSEPDIARWFLRFQDEAIVLVRAQHYSGQPPVSGDHAAPAAGSSPELNPVLGPFSRGERLLESLRSALTRVARAENLLRLAASCRASAIPGGASSIQFKIDAHLERNGELRPAEDLPRVQPGDGLHYIVSNTGNSDLDLTVLYVNSQMGIYPLFPRQNHVNRIRAGQSRTLPIARFTAGPYGRGHFVVIAVAARDQPTDFTWLAQPTIPVARAHRSALDALLESAAFGRGATRGARAEHAAGYCFELLPVQVQGRE